MDCAACHTPNLDGARFCAKCGALLPTPSADAEDKFVGQIIGGRYRIKQLLGEGGMGRVYLAEQQMGTNIRKVAVKTLQAEYAQDAQVLARFHRECGTVSELEHPNTIQFFDFGQTPDGQLYIAMEFVQGQSLSTALQQGPMRPDRVLKILAQVCGSLEEAHGRGVVHRDLKPDNIILTTRAGQADFVKVLDFGIAKRSEAKDSAQEQKLTQQGMVLGTPPYMSPEQFSGKELDARSDIYSLGIMAYEMLTGRLPFEADTAWQWATAHMTAAPYPFESVPAASQVPPGMKQAIMRSLSKNRDDRQANVRAFYEDLASAGGGTSTATPPIAAAHPGATGTAAMPMAASPGGHGNTPQPFTPQPVAHATPGGQTFPAVPAAPAPASKEGSKKGLVIGLAGVAGVLGLATVVIMARQMRQKDDVPSVGPSHATTATGAATLPPQTGTAPIPPPENPVTPPKTDKDEPPENPKTGTASTTPATPKKGSTPPAASPSNTAPPPPALTGDAACAEAKRLADNGDAGGGARVYQGCTGPNAAAAKSAITRAAPDAVKRKIFNGDCAGAKSTLAALNAIGAAGAAQAVWDGAAQCKK